MSWSADLQKGVNAAQRGDFATALRELKPLAEQGNADAQFNLGVMYNEGKGISKDYKTSVKFWRRLAAEQGNAHAQNILGWLYQQGKGVPKNNKTAAKWWTLAAKQGLANALFYKGLLYLISPREIQDNILARLFETISISRGIGIFDNAAYWYLLAAEQGHADAQFNLGVMYDKGRGFPQDYKSAVKWFRFAAEQGKADAQLNLGMIYYQGQGVIKDNVYAYMWGHIAASNGAENIGKLQNFVVKEMTPPQIAEAQKLARECIRKNFKGC